MNLNFQFPSLQGDDEVIQLYAHRLVLCDRFLSEYGVRLCTVGRTRIKRGLLSLLSNFTHFPFFFVLEKQRVYFGRWFTVYGPKIHIKNPLKFQAKSLLIFFSFYDAPNYNLMPLQVRLSPVYGTATGIPNSIAWSVLTSLSCSKILII